LAIERKEARAQIARLAYYDVLTGLPNRTHLRDLISEAIAACPDGKHVALAFLDVDNFKDVNDTLGHSAGDELLVSFAQRLRAEIEPGDILGRLGGDEFVVVLPNATPANPPKSLRELATLWSCRSGSEADLCRCPPAWASVSIRITRPTSILCCSRPMRPCTRPSGRAVPPIASSAPT
jgi:GGDEF domain-containing protein